MRGPDGRGHGIAAMRFRGNRLWLCYWRQSTLALPVSSLRGNGTTKQLAPRHDYPEGWSVDGHEHPHKHTNSPEHLKHNLWRRSEGSVWEDVGVLRMSSDTCFPTSSSSYSVQSMDDQCPICKSDRYLNPKLRLLVSACYHKMCVIPRILANRPSTLT